MQIVICAFNAGYWKSYFVRLSLIGCVCMSACRPPQGEEKMKLLSSCRFLTYGPIIYLQTNLMMYTCGCNVLTADSTSERVISLTIVSAYRPIQCGENVLLAVTSRLGTYYLFYRPMQCREKCSLTTSLGWVSAICFWTNAYAGKTCSMLCLLLSFYLFS